MGDAIRLVLAFSVAGLVTPALAQTTDTDEDWEFRVTPYFLAASLDGKTGIAGVTTDVDMPFGDILDHLDAGFMMTATARKNRWILGVDAIYFKLSGVGSKSVTGPFGVITTEGTVELGSTQQIYQPTIAYRFFGDDSPSLDVYVAARYTSLESELTLTSTTDIPSFPDGTSQLSEDVSWWDPVIGKRVTIWFTERLFSRTVVDFGGFGVGSDVTYQWLAAAGWRFSPHIDAAVGYRYFEQDYEDDDTGFVWDMVASGMIVGVGITF